MLTAIAKRYVERKLSKRQWNPFRQKGKLYRALQFLDGSFVKSRNGVLLQVNIQDNTNRLCIYGYWGDEIARAIENLEEGDIFLDIGASYGLFSLLAAKRVGEKGSVLSFEPNGEIFKFLLNDIKANSANNVIAFNIAASAEYRMLGLNFPTNHSGMGHLVEETRDGIKVPTVDVSDFVCRFGLHQERRVAVKIDVEGHELPILKSLMRGNLSKNIFMVICEVNDQYLSRYGATKKDIYELMEENNFLPCIKSDLDHADEVFLRKTVQNE